MLSRKQKQTDILAVYDRHVDTVYRVCFAYMKNAPEAEDMTQETFLRLMTANKVFESVEHEKAWLIVTASNLCKDTLKKWWRRNEDIDDYLNMPTEVREVGSEVLDAVLRLPEDFKCAVYMYYYEGYTTAEIAQHEGCSESAIRSRLSRARKQLQTQLGGVRR